MFDHTAPLLVPDHMARREAEAGARRLAAVAATASGRTSWVTRGLRAVTHASAALVASLPHVHLHRGHRLTSSQHRA